MSLDASQIRDIACWKAYKSLLQTAPSATFLDETASEEMPRLTTPDRPHDAQAASKLRDEEAEQRPTVEMVSYYCRMGKWRNILRLSQLKNGNTILNSTEICYIYIQYICIYATVSSVNLPPDGMVRLSHACSNHVVYCKTTCLPCLPLFLHLVEFLANTIGFNTACKDRQSSNHAQHLY